MDLEVFFGILLIVAGALLLAFTVSLGGTQVGLSISSGALIGLGVTRIILRD